MKKIIRSITAGIIISISCVTYLSIDNPIVGALAFSLGLLIAMYYGLYLFTGLIGMAETIDDYFSCIIYLFGNISGCSLTAFVLHYFTNIYDKILEKNKTIAYHILEYSDTELFVLGIFCGMLMLVAVRTTKTVITMMCTFTFIICGFEHSIADVFYLACLNSNDCSFQSLLRIIIIVAIGNSIGAKLINFVVEYEDE